MKIKLFTLLVLTGSVLLSSCGTTKLGVLVKDTPPESRSYVEFRNKLEVKEFNFEPVNWKPNRNHKKFSIELPAGEHTFGLTFVEEKGGYKNTHTATTSGKFEPGLKYKVTRRGDKIKVRKKWF